MIDDCRDNRLECTEGGLEDELQIELRMARRGHAYNVYDHGLESHILRKS